jgi:hypothetical protein
VVVEQVQPHPVPDLKLQCTMVDVVVLASIFLSLEKTCVHFGEELVAVREQCVDRLSARCARL